jgi:hypothetical protein
MMLIQDSKPCQQDDSRWEPIAGHQLCAELLPEVPYFQFLTMALAIHFGTLNTDTSNHKSEII